LQYCVGGYSSRFIDFELLYKSWDAEVGIFDEFGDAVVFSVVLFCLNASRLPFQAF
jgi:hypothetical protein